MNELFVLRPLICFTITAHCKLKWILQIAHCNLVHQVFMLLRQIFHDKFYDKLRYTEWTNGHSDSDEQGWATLMNLWFLKLGYWWLCLMSRQFDLWIPMSSEISNLCVTFIRQKIWQTSGLKHYQSSVSAKTACCLINLCRYTSCVLFFKAIITQHNLWKTVNNLNELKTK